MSEISKVETAELHKEIDLIQGCITRMGHNSFMIKGWAFVFVSSFLVAFEKINLDWFITCTIIILMSIAFWILDAFFLKMEKLYRFKYEWVIENRPKGNREHLYDLNPYDKKTRKANKKEPSVVSVMFSKPYTLLVFYSIPILIGIIGIIVKVISCFS